MTAVRVPRWNLKSSASPLGECCSKDSDEKGCYKGDSPYCDHHGPLEPSQALVSIDYPSDYAPDLCFDGTYFRFLALLIDSCGSLIRVPFPTKRIYEHSFFLCGIHPTYFLLRLRKFPDSAYFCFDNWSHPVCWTHFSINVGLNLNPFYVSASGPS